jgi:hypothetical protein
MQILDFALKYLVTNVTSYNEIYLFCKDKIKNERAEKPDPLILKI